jgi:WhiB family transcriptional regulator, redox-sensing transcriptional regulator
MSWKDSGHWLAENAARIRVLRNSEWLQAGACRGLDPATFFPERGEDERRGKAICQTCSVRTECLTYALDAGEKFGIWGGTSERQRRTMRARRRSARLDTKEPNMPTDPKNQKPRTTTCGAKARSGEPCRRPAGSGTDHVGIGLCKHHGGASTHPTYRNKIEVLRHRIEAERAVVALKLDMYGGADVTNPRVVRYFERRIWGDVHGVSNSLTLDALVDHEPDLVQSVTGEHGTQLVEHPLWATLRSERAQLVRVSEACHRAGIEAAMTEANIAAGRLVVSAIISLVQRLGFDPHDPAVAEQMRVAIATAPQLLGRSA